MNKYMTLNNITINSSQEISLDYAKILNDNSQSNLNIGDEDGNIIALFKDGHIKTKEFDSRESGNVNSVNDDSQSNLNIGDENGNVIAEFKNGHFKTKKFDSRLVGNVNSVNDDSSADLNIGDNSGNVLVQFKDGHFKTKNFDSKNISVDNPLKGKKMVGIGDSIMHGQSMGTGPTQPYLETIAKYFEMSYKNYGIGGSTFAQSPLILGDSTRECGGVVSSTSQMSDTEKYYIILSGSPSTTGVGNYSGTAYYYNGSSWVTAGIAPRTPISARYSIMDNDAELIIVAAGTNDFQYNWTEIGTIDDAKANEPSATTFYGSVAYVCKGLIEKYPSKTIIFMTPIKRGQTQTTTSDTTAHRGGSYGTQDSVNVFGKTLKEYGDIIKEVCTRFSIPVIDMYANCNLTPFVSTQQSYFDSYKTHPGQVGHDIMARYIIAQIKTIYGKSI